MDFSLSENSNDNDIEKLQEQYEKLKLVLVRIQATFSQGIGGVTDLLNQWKPHLKEEFLVALTTNVSNIQEKIKQIVTQDPNALQVASISQQIAAYEREKLEWEQQKTKGVELLQALQRKNAELEKQLLIQNTELQKQQHYQVSANGYEAMTINSQDISDFPPTTQDGFIQNPHDEIIRLKNLIDLGKQKLASQTEQIEQLSRENKSLHDDIHQLYSTLKEKGLAKPYRLNTMTNWKEEDLEELEAEIAKKGAEMRKEDLKRKFERQEEMYWQTQGIPEDAETQGNEKELSGGANQDNDSSANMPSTYRTQTIIHHGDGDEEDEEKKESNIDDDKVGKTHVLRSATQMGSWNENDLQAVKNEMMGELQKIKNQHIAQMVEKQDELRMQKMNPNGVRQSQELEEFVPTKEVPVAQPSGMLNNTENNLGDDQMSQLRNEIMAEMHRLHLRSMKEMFEREEKLRWDVKDDQSEKANLMTEESATLAGANDLERMQQEMMVQLREMTRQELNNMFEKQFRLRENQPTDFEEQNPTTSANPVANDNIHASSGPRNLVHPKTSLADDELEKLRQEMLEELNNKQRIGLTAMIEKQEKIRWTGYDTNASGDTSTNSTNNDRVNPNKEEKETRISPNTDEQLNEKKKDLEEKVSLLIRQLEDERTRKNNIQTRLEELVENYETRLTDANKLRNGLQDEIVRLTDSKVTLVKTTAWQLDNLRRVINALLQIESCKKITKMLLDDSLRYGTK